MNFIKAKIAQLNAKAICAATEAKAALENNDGMELVQILIIMIISIVLGLLLKTTLEKEFGTQLTAVGTKLTGMFS